MKAKSYSLGAQDPRTLLRAYAPAGSGDLELAEFTQAIRRGGKIPKVAISDEELRWIFNELDVDGGGVVGLDELTDFIWGTNYAQLQQESMQQKQTDDSWRMAAVNFLDTVATELDDGS